MESVWYLCVECILHSIYIITYDGVSVRFIYKIGLAYYKFMRDFYQGYLDDLRDFKNSQSIMDTVPDFDLDEMGFNDTLYLEKKVPDLRKTCKSKIKHYNSKIIKLEERLSR